MRTAVVYRETVEWRARMSCGHHRQLGYTMPYEVLDQLGYINEGVNDAKDEVFDECVSEDMRRRRELEAWARKLNQLSTRRSLFY